MIRNQASCHCALQAALAVAQQHTALTRLLLLPTCRCAQEAGLSVDQVAPRLSFFFAVGINFFEEVAKLRAARRLWARMVRDKFAPQKESSLVLRCAESLHGAAGRVLMGRGDTGDWGPGNKWL